MSKDLFFHLLLEPLILQTFDLSAYFLASFSLSFLGDWAFFHASRIIQKEDPALNITWCGKC